jgi:beta-galactosidase
MKHKMKNRQPSFVRLLTLAAALFTLNLSAADSPREHLLLDANWKFHLGDDWPNALYLNKAGANKGPAGEGFDDAAWRTVNLPHDWAVELPFDPAADVGHGFKPVGPGFPATSVGWYRRTLDLPEADSGKRIWLQFDGAFRDTTLYVNGWFVGHYESGYYPFRADITDVVHFGKKNTIAARVDASRFEGWFYEGAGIYRHVWLDKTEPVAIAGDGIFVYSKFPGNVPGGAAELHAEVRLSNALDKPVEASIVQAFFDPNGTPVGEMKQTANLAPVSQETFTTDGANQHLALDKYELWSPESPKLYKLVTTVSVDGKVVDRQETAFGIRTTVFDAKEGFLLNGKHYEICGTCNHQDHAGVGEALPDALQYFRVAKLKEFSNALRTAHNPPTPELLDACDRLGLLVMDESRTLGSDEANIRRWETQVRRDRNHPSVIFWSLCNEEAKQTDLNGGRVGATMQALANRLDPTRAVTAAENVGDIFTGLPGTLEVRGWNYNITPERAVQVEAYHAKHPNQPNLGTEQGANRGTRGIYTSDPKRGYVSARPGNIERWWPFFADRPWLSGAFDWTGFDYRGEPTPYHSWHNISSTPGILDTCGFPKDNYYYFQSWWTSKPVLHLEPHWNWPGQEGQEIEVDALSNASEVELFLNGQSLGRKPVPRNYHAEWMVKYAPGTLSAKGYDNGKVVSETKVETTGEPVSVALTPDRAKINADGEDVSVFTVAVKDAAGRIVPTAMNKIHFELAGAGHIIGVGNGDPTCLEPDTYVAQPQTQSIPVKGWRWKLGELPESREIVPPAAVNFDDSSWPALTTPAPGPSGVVPDGEAAIFRAHLALTKEELANPGVQLRFPDLGTHGMLYVNGKRIADSNDWMPRPPIDLRKSLHVGDNVIVVFAFKESSKGDFNTAVTLELTSAPVMPPSPWMRSVFNGLAQVILQSSKEPGTLTLTATGEGLKPAAVSVQSQPCAPHPSVP